MNDDRKRGPLATVATLLLILPVFPAHAAQEPEGRPTGEVRIDMTQARVTLELLAARARGETVERSRWARVFESEGYRRVLNRERAIDEQLGIDRGISDASFIAWAESDEALSELEGRQRTLEAWATVDIDAVRSRARAYLPPRVRLAATVYPIVRRQSNSFVWDLRGDPAIFMAVGPDVSVEEIEATLAHELHHVGLAGGCTDAEPGASAEVTAALGWLSGFGEGLAVLAAAGGPDAPTHPAGRPSLRRAWAARMDSLEVDMRRIESFLLDVAKGRIEGEEARRRGMAFVNTEDVPQGGFYSVGWFMGATVERRLGREAVIAATCDHGRLLVDYQRAAALAEADDPANLLPRWSPELLEVLGLNSGRD